MKLLRKKILLSLALSVWCKVAFSQAYDRDLPYVDPTGAYQLFSFLKQAIPSSPQNQIAMDAIDRYLEVQYNYGGNGGREGIDCSALILNVYKEAFERKMPRTAAEQYKLGYAIEDKQQLHFGDLVFFKINRKTVSHVGMYLDSGHFVHASSSLGVTINNLDESYYKKRYIGAKRIIETN